MVAIAGCVRTLWHWPQPSVQHETNLLAPQTSLSRHYVAELRSPSESFNETRYIKSIGKGRTSHTSAAPQLKHAIRFSLVLNHIHLFRSNSTGQQFHCSPSRSTAKNILRNTCMNLHFCTSTDLRHIRNLYMCNRHRSTYTLLRLHS